MGKKKEDSMESDSLSESPQKKHKRHKKHKHRKRRNDDDDDEVEEEEDDLMVDVTELSPPAIKLKIKMGAETLGTKNLAKPIGNKKEKDKAPGQAYIKDDVFKTKKPGEDTSDEEKEWLSALEKGELDESGGVKKCKDPLLMTARQRARLHGKAEEELMELPSGYKDARDSEMTEEQISRRQQKAKRRKEQAHQKAEKDKKQTLERLLKKQESARGKGKGKMRKARAPAFRYMSTPESISISVPPGYKLPFQAQTAPTPPGVVRCGVAGCLNEKKYSCSRTALPLCSLECYKKNLALCALDSAS